MLLVDDIAANLLAMEAILRRDDLAVVTARSAREAMDILLHRPVCVAIIDVQMPEMDGIELAENMRGVERTRHVPIIFVTASLLAHGRVFQGYEAGAVDFLVKPIDERILRSKVDVFVALDRQRRQLAIALDEAQSARRETELLFRLAELTSHCKKPEELYDPALDAARALLGADRASIRLFDDAGTLRFRAWRGLSDGCRAGLTGHVVWPTEAAAPRPILIGDLIGEAARDERTAAHHELLAHEGIAAVAFVPLVHQRRRLGTFELYWNRTRAFSRHDEDLALTIASHLAQALERARLLEVEHRAEEHLRLALESGEMGVWKWTPSSGRVAWSPKLEQIHGYAPGSFPGTFEAYAGELHPDDRDQVLAQLRASVDEKQDHALEHRIVRRDGQVRWVAGRGKVFTDAEGKVTSLTGIYLDVTDRVEFERLREKALADLKRDIQLNEMFVGILGHDLRSPLSSIAMASSLLAMQPGLPPAQRETVRRIASAGERMTRLVGQLLDLTRSRLGGGIPVEPRPCDLVAIVRAVIVELELAHPDRRFVLEGETGLAGRWDGDRIAQLASNLIGNAAIYSDGAAPVRVDVTAEPAGARLRVHNTGAPIPPDILPAIFEPYVRGRHGTATGGLGLGLYISAQIVRAHGGRIDVTSTAADGTAFIVVLPR